MGQQNCRILYKVENRNPISYRREEVCAIWIKQEVASTVDRSKEI